MQVHHDGNLAVGISLIGLRDGCVDEPFDGCGVVSEAISENLRKEISTL